MVVVFLAYRRYVHARARAINENPNTWSPFIPIATFAASEGEERERARVPLPFSPSLAPATQRLPIRGWRDAIDAEKNKYKWWRRTQLPQPYRASRNYRGSRCSLRAKRNRFVGRRRHSEIVGIIITDRGGGSTAIKRRRRTKDEKPKYEKTSRSDFAASRFSARRRIACECTLA